MPKPFVNELRRAVAQGASPDALVVDLPRLDARVRGGQRLAASRESSDARLQFEREAWGNGFSHVAGVDEAGRGPLAGPIVAAAVVLAEPIAELDDSKRLTAEQRERLFVRLHEGEHQIGVAVIDAATIDRDGIQSANYAAMAQAAAAIDPTPDFLLVDGFAIRGCSVPQLRLVKGDQRSLSIAAASIVAKVTRDRLMDEFEARFPGYGFIRHKGYGTKEHLAALARLGPCPEHRRSFAPLAQSLETRDLF